MREVFSDIIYDELFSDIEIVSTPTPPSGAVWQWESGATVQWESGADVDLE